MLLWLGGDSDAPLQVKVQPACQQTELVWFLGCERFQSVDHQRFMTTRLLSLS